ncbi:hypothetical protein DF186_17010, partial [Enterococcus hirae]
NILSSKKLQPLRFDEVQERSVNDNIEEKIFIEDAIKKLSIDEYEVLYLREFAGHSYKEMAEIMETSIDNVKVKLFRVRQKLRKYLR